MKYLLALLLLIASPVWAQHYRQPSQMSLDGTFTFATLPSASTYTGYTAYTSDQGPVYSDGSLWHSMSGGGIPPTIATNTVLGNATNATAAPTALAVGTCSTSASALIWTTNTGFGCNTSINAGSLGGATFANPGAIGGGTPAAGTFTTLSATAATFPLANVSAATWTRVSPAFNVAAFTLNDTTASGTVNQDSAVSIQPPIFTSTGGASTTISFPTAFSVGLPTCSGGVICTTPLAAYFDGATKVNGLFISVGATINGATNINANNNNATNIGTGTTTQTVTLGGGANAVTVNATTATIGATTVAINGATTNTGALTVTGLITPSTTVGIKGTAAADAAQAGSVGEVFSLNCLMGAAAAAGSAVSLPVASPGVVTWTSHTFTVTGPTNYTCPINFSANGGALPTGLVAGTTYYIIGSTVSGDTFQVADTAAHALAGTNAVNFTGSPSGSPLAWIGYLVSTGNVVAGAGYSLTAGDWDCSGTGNWQELTSLTTTQFSSGVSTTVAQGTNGNYSDIRTSAIVIGAVNYSLPTPTIQQNISGTTTVYLINKASFSGGTQNSGGRLFCRRMR